MIRFPSPLCLRLVAMVLVPCILAACGQGRPGASSATSGEHVTASRYRIDITYPPLSPQADALTRALHARAATARAAFLKTVQTQDAGASAPPDHPLRLVLEFQVATRTARLLSVREKGLVDTGGAHPQPLIGTFVFDMRSGKVLGFDDLFTDPAATRIKLAAFARKSLYASLLDKVPGGDATPAPARALWRRNMRGMIDAGTAPSTANYSRFLVESGGLDQPLHLTLVFAPYQVAPYAYGVQTVDVPLRFIAGDLKPAVRPLLGLAP